MSRLIIELRADDDFTQCLYEIPIRSEKEAEAVAELVSELIEVLRGDLERSEAYQ